MRFISRAFHNMYIWCWLCLFFCVFVLVSVFDLLLIEIIVTDASQFTIWIV